MIRVYNHKYTDIIGKPLVAGDGLIYIVPEIGQYREYPDTERYKLSALVDNSYGNLAFQPPLENTAQTVAQLQAQLEALQVQLAQLKQEESVPELEVPSLEQTDTPDGSEEVNKEPVTEEATVKKTRK